MPSYPGLPFQACQGENCNGNIAMAAPAFDEDKLLVYREIYFDGFCTVIAARDLTSGGAVAIKKINFDHLGNCFANVKLLQRSITAKLRKQTVKIKTLSHPAVIKTLDFVLEPRRIVVITEMCLFGDLFNWMLQQRTIRLRDSLLIIHGLFQAFQFLHDNDYTHGSLKPTNVLFQTISPHSLVVLPDLSIKKEISKLMNDPLAQCQSCTAPEELTRLANSSVTPPQLSAQDVSDPDSFGTKEMDIWSIGVIALIALTGINFFNFNSLSEMKSPLDARLEKAFSHPIFTLCDQKLVTCLKRFLKIDPKERATAEDGANMHWIEEAKALNDERNLLFIMEYDLMSTCKSFRLYGQTVVDKIFNEIRQDDLHIEPFIS